MTYCKPSILKRKSKDGVRKKNWLWPMEIWICYRFWLNAEMLRIISIALTKIEVSTALDLTKLHNDRILLIFRK